MRTAAIIGMGRMGRRHGQVVKELGLDLVGVVDALPESLQVAKQELSLDDHQCFADVDALLADAKPDVVVVATHAPSHDEYVLKSAAAGVKAILCEKPMAVSLKQCDTMIDECRRHGVRLAVNHQMRFMEQYTIPKRIADSESLGGLKSVTVVAGNFGMAMNGTHYFEMFRFMTDQDPTTVNAWFASDPLPNPRGPMFEDRSGSIRLSNALGQRFTLDAGSDQGHGMAVLYACRNGQIFVDELAGKMRVVARLKEHASLPTTRYGMPFSEEWSDIKPADAVQPTKAVLEALLSQADYPTGEQGRLAVHTLAAGYVSDENANATVGLDDPRIRRDRVFPWA